MKNLKINNIIIDISMISCFLIIDFHMKYRGMRFYVFSTSIKLNSMMPDWFLQHL